ncbi:MAG: M56 family metallopeptidase [Eubacterium sp.]|nr:M56 family metallopeptidase [Eubacterium sp.]
MITAGTIIQALLDSCLMAALLSCLAGNTTFLKKYGTMIPSMLTLCCMVRMIFPLALPGPNAGSGPLRPPAAGSKIITDPVLLKLILILWAAGALIYLISYSLFYQVTLSRIHENAIYAEEDVAKLLKDLDPDCPMGIYVSPDIHVPISTGIFHSNIYLADYRYSPEELYYLILHEYIHWKRKDMTRKFLCYLAGALVWWNPIATLVRRKYIRLLELSCDRDVAARLQDEEILDYLQALYHTQILVHSQAKTSCHSCLLPIRSAVMGFTNSGRPNRSVLVQRFQLLLDRNQTKPKDLSNDLPTAERIGRILVPASMILIILVWMALSYKVIPSTSSFSIVASMVFVTFLCFISRIA